MTPPPTGHDQPPDEPTCWSWLTPPVRELIDLLQLRRERRNWLDDSTMTCDYEESIGGMPMRVYHGRER